MNAYQAGLIKRRRASQAEMGRRSEFLIEYTTMHGPVTVRQLFYAAVAAGMSGIEKSGTGRYGKVQTQVLALRRAGAMPYHVIADASRYMREPRTFDGWEDALQSTARLYRKSLWADRDIELEVWLEKSALAGVIQPVTSEYDVPLMVTSGFTSETFPFEAVDDLRRTKKTLVILALYDFDRSGRDAEASLREKVERFGSEFGVDVEFHPLTLTEWQVGALNLPSRPAKRTTKADERWPYSFAAELDAIPPHTLRAMVRSEVENYLPADELRRLKAIEAAERETLLTFIGREA